MNAIESVASPRESEPTLKGSIRAYCRADNWHNLLYLAREYGFIFTAILACKLFPSIPLYLGAILLISARMRALDSFTHEASHGNLFRNPTLNYWAGLLLCAFPVGSSLTAYRVSHADHHRYLADPERDPDRVRYRELGVDAFPTDRPQLIRHFLKVFLLMHVPGYVWGAVKGYVYSPEVPQFEQIARWLFWGGAIALILVCGWEREFLLFWLVPYLSLFQIIRYLSEISEHGGLYGAYDATRPIRRELQVTRSNFCHPLLRFFVYPLGDRFHILHHLYPSVPHYNYERVHELLLEDDAYRQGHHCYGYFFALRRDRPSTAGQMLAS